MTGNSQLDTDSPQVFEVRWLVIEKITFVLLVILIILAAQGLLDGKKTSQPVAGLPISITYEKFTRFFGTSQIELHVNKPLPGNILHLTLGGSSFKYIDVSDIIPRAISEAASAEGVNYAFALEPDNRGTIRLKIKSKFAGLNKLGLIIEGKKFTVRQFTYP